jgi:hypothetical protein
MKAGGDDQTPYVHYIGIYLHLHFYLLLHLSSALSASVVGEFGVSCMSVWIPNHTQPRRR